MINLIQVKLGSLKRDKRKGLRKKIKLVTLFRVKD